MKIDLDDGIRGSRFLDLVGQRFGQMLVLSVVGKYRGEYCFECRCECGTLKVVRQSHLRRGAVVSCGCEMTARAYRNGKKNLAHGASSSGGSVDPTPEYTTWKRMKERCFYEKHKSYDRYGGRGISVCDRWLNGEDGRSGFECFLEDMGEKPSASHSIDRYPDNDGNYEPGNCRWATASEQHWSQRGRRRDRDG